MNTIISRMLVLGLLFSFVHAQEPSRDINKDEAKNARSEQKGKSAKKDKANRTDMPDGVSSDYEQKHTNVKNVTGVEKGGSATGKLGPGGGNSARMGSDTAVGKKSGKQAKKGFLGRLFGRSSKKASSTGSVAGVGGSPRPGSKSGGQTGGKQPSAGGDKQQQPKGPAGEKPQGQGDDGP